MTIYALDRCDVAKHNHELEGSERYTFDDDDDSSGESEPDDSNHIMA